MVIFPGEKPVIENLNSYYLETQKLLEHYQGQLDSGVIHFRSATAEGAIFFDKDGLLEGVYEGRGEHVKGKAAVDHLIRSASADNYTISVYQIEADQIYFWSSILSATRIYENLSAEFTDPDGLIKKMASEKLSGYIEMSLNPSGERGAIFFRNGQFLGGSYSWEKSKLDRSREGRDSIIRKAKAGGAVFHVSSIPAVKAEDEGKATKAPSQEIVEPLEELLVLVENLFHSSKSIKGDFRTLLKKKFLKLAETYPFLDPFAGEFDYQDHKIRFRGEASEADLAAGVFASIKSLAKDVDVKGELKVGMDGWLKKHGRKLVILGVKP
jgi:hypothetical protein